MSAWSAGLLPTPAHAAECHPYGTTLTLAGSYSQAVTADSPTGDSDPRSAPGRTANLLLLDVPLCVATDTVSGGVPAALNVQVLCPGRDMINGEVVSITGRLGGAHTGNGHTPVLLVCSS